MRAKVAEQGERYRGANLIGAMADVDYALFEAGFADPEVKKTGELERMVIYSCRPNLSPADEHDVVRRLEHAWIEDGSFAHEAHTITVEGGLVALDFVTWWDSGAFYTRPDRGCALSAGLAGWPRAVQGRGVSCGECSYSFDHGARDGASVS